MIKLWSEFRLCRSFYHHTILLYVSRLRSNGNDDDKPPCSQRGSEMQRIIKICGKKATTLSPPNMLSRSIFTVAAALVASATQTTAFAPSHGEWRGASTETARPPPSCVIAARYGSFVSSERMGAKSYLNELRSYRRTAFTHLHFCRCPATAVASIQVH